MLPERHHLAIQRLHGRDMPIALAELDTVDARKELLEMRLDHSGIRGLTKDLQQVVVADEVEAREQAALFLFLDRREQYYNLKFYIMEGKRGRSYCHEIQRKHRNSCGITCMQLDLKEYIPIYFLGLNTLS